MRRTWPVVLLFAACSDLTGPAGPDALPDRCASAFACRSAGVDIQVVSLDLAATRQDAATGLDIMHPDSVPVSVVLRNVGSDTAAADDVYLTLRGPLSTYAQTFVPYPALAPGEEFRFSSVVHFEPYGPTDLRDDRVQLELMAIADHDAAFGDNHATSATFHLAVPLLQYAYSLSTDNITAGEAVALNVVARNYGRHADAPARIMTACLYADFTGCTAQYRTTAGAFMAPPVPAGSVVQFQAMLAIPATAAWQDAAVVYSMALCDATSFAPAYLSDIPPCYAGARLLSVRPDYENVCGAPQMLPGIDMTLTGYNCGLRPVPAGQETTARRYRFHLVAFDAAADVTYQVQRSDTTAHLRLYNVAGVAVLDRDAAPDRFRVAAAQRLYLIHYSAQESFTIRVTPTQEGA